jgi:PAS domain S-box-containing protein
MSILPPDAPLRLAAIVRSSDDAIVSKDLDGIITSWNAGAERLFGYTEADAVGQSIRMIIPPDRQAEEDRVLSSVRAGHIVESFDTVRKRKDGGLVDVSVTVSPIHDAQGRIIGASKIARNITERKRIERALQVATEVAEYGRLQASFLAEASAALGASLDYQATLGAVARLAVPTIADWCAVDIVDHQGKLRRLAVAHIDPAKVELARGLEERYPADPQAPGGIHEVIRTGKPAFMETIPKELLQAVARDEEHRRIIDELKLVSYMCVPLTAHGITTGAITFVSAESGRHYNHDDLNYAMELASRASLAVDNAQAYATASEANRVKDEFLATLSHELRTPLNAILGYARMLRVGTIAPDRVNNAIEVVERNATALKQIVEDVLDVSRIVAGRLRLNVEAVDLPIILREAVETLLPAAHAKGVEVVSVIDPLTTPVSGDPDRLLQIVWNLLSNAIKFTRRGGKVQLQLSRVNSHVEIAVSDTGRGISPEFLPHVFEHFRQADASFSREHGGLGLGLGIVKQLTELHGGTVTAASDGSDRGATFIVRLPLMIVHASPGAPQRREQPAADRRPVVVESIPRLDGLQVLAVDDEVDSLGLLRAALESAGASVTTAESAEAALAILRQQTPDVMIADIGMPGMDGLQLIRSVRALDVPARAIPAAALTAYARSQDRITSLTSGFQMHLVKPIDPLELIVAVATLAPRRIGV